MIIKSLTISNFRNITQATLNFSANFNIIYGHNGSGKTSLLEAIYQLGHGKSFRTRMTKRIIKHEQPNFLIRAELTDPETENIVPAGVERHMNGDKQFRLAGEPLTSISEITKTMPIQLIPADSYNLLLDGPDVRRQFMDWGLFHVKPDFLSVWRQYHSCLKQRNAAIRANLPTAQIIAWDQQLIESGSKLNEWRSHYTESLQPLLFELLDKLVPSHNLTLSYRSGWDKTKSISEALEAGLMRDLQIGYTVSGPHRAELFIGRSKVTSPDLLSQGQLKLLSYALRLAQGILLRQTTDKTLIFLIDDMPSELDPIKREIVTEVLKSLDCQVILTGITAEDLEFATQLPDASMFHVKQGEFTPVQVLTPTK